MDLLRWTGPLGARVASMIVALALSGCGSAPQDESVGWSPEKLYSEAKAEMSAGAYDKAAKLLERLGPGAAEIARPGRLRAVASRLAVA